MVHGWFSYTRSMHTISAGLSDVGKARQQNEDSFVANDELGFYAVSDGMGGHAAGEVASALALETVLGRVQQHRSELRQIAAGEADALQLSGIANRAVEEACMAVYRKATTNPDMSGMGCTLTFVVVAGSYAVLGHVGDSRCYLVRGGELHQLSTDHTIAGELLRSGHLSPEDVKTHQYGHALTRAIGPQEAVQADILPFSLTPGDRLLLCSDGLSGYLATIKETAAMVIDSDDLNVVVDGLIKHANDGGGRDNITAVVVKATAASKTSDVALSLAHEAQIQIEAISSVPAFADLPLGHLSRTLAHCKVASFAEGDVVFSPGEKWAALTVVLDGSFSLGIGESDERTLRAGDNFGASALLRPKVASTTLRAAEPSRLLLLYGGEFDQLAKERPWLGVALLTKIGRGLAEELQSLHKNAAGPRSPLSSLEAF